MTIKNILKIKNHGIHKISFTGSQTSVPINATFSYIVDERLEDLFIPLKIKTRRHVAGINKKDKNRKFIVVYQNNNKNNNRIKEFEKGKIIVDLENHEIPIINNEMKKDHIKKALKDKEFEITTREVEVEL